MNKTIRLLSIILGIQLLLVGVASARWHTENQWQQQPLITDGLLDALQTISINDGEKELKLLRKGNSWVADEERQLPVSSFKLKAVMDDLEQLDAHWPVAASDAAAERFEVAEDDFRKQLVLSSDGQQQKLLLGTSPGFRQLHVRDADNPEIFSVQLAEHELSTDINQWLDKQLLKTPKALLMSLQLGQLSFKNENGQWRLEGLADNEAVNQENLDKLLNFSDQLSVNKLVDTEQWPQLDKQEPAYQLSLNTGAATIDYRVVYQQGKAFVKSSLRDEWFEMPTYRADSIKSMDRSALVSVDTETDGTSEVSDSQG